jgi:hypothetical protein
VTTDHLDAIGEIDTTAVDSAAATLIDSPGVELGAKPQKVTAKKAARSPCSTSIARPAGPSGLDTSTRSS